MAGTTTLEALATLWPGFVTLDLSLATFGTIDTISKNYPKGDAHAVPRTYQPFRDR